MLRTRCRASSLIFLDRDDLARLDAEGGRLRSYLLGAFKHWLGHERERRAAIKRGGDRRIGSLDLFDPESAEKSYRVEPADLTSPEGLYSRRWALTVLGRVFERLREEQEDRGRARVFDALKGCVLPGESLPSYAELAAELGLSESAIKVSVHRLKSRYRQLLLEEIAETVDSHEEVEDELRTLIEALSPPGQGS